MLRAFVNCAKTVLPHWKLEYVTTSNNFFPPFKKQGGALKL
jgi:hypothetical protein